MAQFKVRTLEQDVSANTLSSSTFVGVQSDRLFHVANDGFIYNTNSSVFGTVQDAVTSATNYQDSNGGNVYIVLPPVVITEDFTIPRGSSAAGSLGTLSSHLIFTCPYNVSERAVALDSNTTCVIKMTETLEITRNVEFVGVCLDMITPETSVIKCYNNTTTDEKILVKFRFSTVYGNMQTPFVPPSTGSLTPVIDFTDGLANVIVLTDSTVQDKTANISSISIKFGSTNGTFTDNFGGHIFGYIQQTGTGSVWLNNGLLHRGVMIGETDGSSTNSSVGSVTINNCLTFGSSYIHTSDALADGKFSILNCTVGGNASPFVTATTISSNVRMGGNISASGGVTPTFPNVTVVVATTIE